MGWGRPRHFASLCVALGAVALATPARADTTFASVTQSDTFGADVSLAGVLFVAEPASAALEPLGGALSLEGHYFPLRRLGLLLDLQYAGFTGEGSTSPGGGFFLLTGLRFQPFLESWGTPFVDGKLGLGATGGQAHFALDFDVGVRFPIGWLRVGPVLHLEDLTADGTPGGDSVLLWMGFSVGFGA